ncbi:hypothetical protein PBY51_013551 [Eleginops maclovinus]|uniref:Uncharacterized protein n=1 Tax=Eleginops maclovinus TaxID=56733 RepID=A0AAN8AUJ7_ELEMC|nr:hypothetical protein PBY51_013551 [Eleginops maclovinus]
MRLCPSSSPPAYEMTDSVVWGLFPHTVSFPGQRSPGTLYDVPNPAAPGAPGAEDTHNTLALSPPQLILERPSWLPGEL